MRETYARGMPLSFLKGVPWAVLSSLMLVFSFPGWDLGVLAWVALVPLLEVIRRCEPKAAFGLPFLCGMVFFMGTFSWINAVDGFRWHHFVLMGVYLSAYLGLFGLGVAFVSRNTRLPWIVTVPVLWVSLEYLRSNMGFLALPWALLGHSQYKALSVIQISALAGAYGVSFLAMMVNAALSELVTGRAKGVRPALATCLVVGACLGYGYLHLMDAPGDDTIDVKVVQGNIPQASKWDSKLRSEHLMKHIRLTRDDEPSIRPSLVVWPESAVYGMGAHLSRRLIALAKETGAHLLVGSAQRPKSGPGRRGSMVFNSAFLVSPRSRIDGPYNKVHLLPFAERLPYRDVIPWPRSLASRAADFSPGEEYTLFLLDGVRFGVAICWENIFPDLFRQFVRNGARFMVNITNEAWFGRTAAPNQFLSMSVFRAVENRVSVVRAANTGISCFIDPFGRLLGKVARNGQDVFIEGQMTRTVPLRTGQTFYSSHGDIFAHALLAAAALMVIAAAAGRKGSSGRV